MCCVEYPHLESSFDASDRVMQLKAYIEQVKQQARALGYVTTLNGRHRPIKGLSSNGSANNGAVQHKAAAEADRKAVNSTIQGSAADLIKRAMCSWAQWQHKHLTSGKLCSLHACLLTAADTNAQVCLPNSVHIYCCSVHLRCLCLINSTANKVIASFADICTATLTDSTYAGGRQRVQLVAQIHDELLFEVDAQHSDAYLIAGKCKLVWRAQLLCHCQSALAAVHLSKA